MLLFCLMNAEIFTITDVASVRPKHVFDASGAEKATRANPTLHWLLLADTDFENFHKAWWHSVRYIWVQ